MALVRCICEVCGKTFDRRPSVVFDRTFCSRQRFGKSTRTRPKKICTICKHQYVNKNEKHCSRECYMQSKRGLKTCRGCGALMVRDLNTSGKQYCTWDCFKKSRHVVLQCHVCGNSFESYLSEAKKREARGHKPCCSASCRNTYTSILLGGDGSWVVGGRYIKPGRSPRPGWRKIREAYMRSVGGRCEGCETEPAINVHHLHPIASGGELLDFDNLMAVCKSCHDNMHEQLRSGAFDCSLAQVRDGY